MWRLRWPTERAGTVTHRRAAPLPPRGIASSTTRAPIPSEPDRIRAIEALLEQRDWLGYEPREAPRAELEQLLRVHPESLRRVGPRPLRARRGLRPGHPTSPGSWEAALRAAGAACALVEALVAGEAPTGFCALRPPGHHAERERAMGFCLFANVAIAARHALDALGCERVLVLDWDVHHGNGTQAIFDASPDVLFVSLHQWPFWPGSGALADCGSGPGQGFTINLPVPAGSGEDEWLGLVEHVAMPAARAFEPDLVLVSAGFDAHVDDPLAECRLGDRELRGSWRATCARWPTSLGVPCGAVLEGGYDVDALAASVAATMDALARGGEPRSVARGPLVEAEASQVARLLARRQRLTRPESSASRTTARMPSRRIRIGNSSRIRWRARLWASPSIAERALDARGHVGRVLGGIEHAGVAHHLGHRGHVHHHRHAAREHGLGHRQPEALVARRLHVHRRAPVEVGSSSSSESQPVNSTLSVARPAAARSRRRATCRRTRSARRAGAAPPPRTAGGPSASASSSRGGPR